MGDREERTHYSSRPLEAIVDGARPVRLALDANETALCSICG